MADLTAPPSVKYIADAARLRAAHYREEAFRLRALADREPLAQIRRHLAQLARQYEEMAVEAEPVKRRD